jgi:two-component system NtrC family sensor kinase
MGKANIIPQDIGRVILNLINNAFYAVNERRKVEGVGYEPTLAISTGPIQSPLVGRGIQIKVSDNGGGIPSNILDKILQPLFTTKPTGQGTGLGLSLSYDIIKAHGGEIKVETKGKEETIFIISISV